MSCRSFEGGKLNSLKNINKLEKNPKDKKKLTLRSYSLTIHCKKSKEINIVVCYSRKNFFAGWVFIKKVVRGSIGRVVYKFHNIDRVVYQLIQILIIEYYFLELFICL